MSAGLKVVPITRLDAADRAKWLEWLDCEQQPVSPFLTPEYAEVARLVAPNGEISRLEVDGQTIGFWPLQRRGGTLQPLGAPLNDYQRLILAPNVDGDLAALIHAADASRFCFSGLALSGRAEHGLARIPMIADLSAGFDAYFEKQHRVHRKYFKDKRRQGRQLEGELGPLTFLWHDVDPAAFEWLLARKRRQFYTTAQYDVFSCGWTERLLRELVSCRSPDFGGSVATLRAGTRIVAAIYTLRAGRTCHIWFPTYDPALARHSPGAASILRLLQYCSSQGIDFADFGLEGEHYKQYFASPQPPVYEGCVAIRGKSASARPKGFRELRRPERLLIKAQRRMFVLSACEPNWITRAASLATMTATMIGKRFKPDGAIKNPVDVTLA